MMELLPDARYNFVFAAPDDLTPWDLSQDVMEEALLQVDPQADIHREYSHCWFDAAFPFGGIDGTMDPTMVGLRSASTEMATRFVVWLRARVLPAGAGIAFMTHEAIELRHEPCVLPDSDDPQAVQDAMTPYLRTVVTEYNT